MILQLIIVPCTLRTRISKVLNSHSWFKNLNRSWAEMNLWDFPTDRFMLCNEIRFPEFSSTKRKGKNYGRYKERDKVTNLGCLKCDTNLCPKTICCLFLPVISKMLGETHASDAMLRIWIDLLWAEDNSSLVFHLMSSREMSVVFPSCSFSQNHPTMYFIGSPCCSENGESCQDLGLWGDSD